MFARCPDRKWAPRSRCRVARALTWPPCASAVANSLIASRPTAARQQALTAELGLERFTELSSEGEAMTVDDAVRLVRAELDQMIADDEAADG